MPGVPCKTIGDNLFFYLIIAQIVYAGSQHLTGPTEKHQSFFCTGVSVRFALTGGQNETKTGNSYSAVHDSDSLRLFTIKRY
jgi:hypothetical protein